MKTREVGQTHLHELLDIIQLTESVALSIRSAEDEAGILTCIADEFSRSANHEAAALMLSEDAEQIKVASLSIRGKLLKTGLKLLGQQIHEMRFALADCPSLERVITKGDTFSLPTADIACELFPNAIARAFVELTGYQDDTTILAPLKRFNKNIGILVIFATTLPELAIPSIRNLAAHISTSLEVIAKRDEQKAAERALREAEEKFSKAFLATPNAVTIMRASDNTILDVNDHFLKVSGFKREELIGQSAEKYNFFAFPEDSEKLQEYRKNNIHPNNLELHFRSRLGDVRTCLYSSSGVFIGGEECIMSMAVDITESKQAQLALREAEEKISTTFQHIPEGITVYRQSDGVILEINDAFTKYTGLKREDVIGRPSSQINLWADPEELQGFREKMRREGRIYNEEARMLDASGNVRTCINSVEPIEINGEPCAIFISTDITERKAAEDNYRMLAENSEDVIFRISLADDYIKYASPSAERLFGYTPREALSLKVSDILTPESYEYQKAETVKNLAAGNLAGTMELEAVHKDGRIISIETNSRVIFDESGQPVGYIGSIRDITGRKLAENSIQHLNSTLQSIRGINRLIAREENRGALIKGVCEHLVGTHSCLTAWIVLFDEQGEITDAAESGLDDRFSNLLGKMKRNEMMPCIRQSQQQSRTVVVEDTSKCSGCFAVGHQPGMGNIVVPLKHEEHSYGTLCISLPSDAAASEAELALYEGAAQDIALGLYRLELEELREETEAALRESEEFSQSLLEKAPNPITVVNEDTSIQYVNPAFEKLIGWSAEDVTGMKAPYPWWPKNNVKNKLDGLKELWSTGHGMVEDGLQTRAGDYLTVELNVQRIVRDDGSKYYLGIWMDHTEYVKATKALIESEERFSMAFRASPDAMIMTSAETGRIEEVNDNYCLLTGYTREEIIGRTPLELGVWNNPEDRRMMWHLLNAKGRVSKMEICPASKTGEKRPCLISIEKVNIGGKPYYLSALTDITDRKRIEEALRESEERWYRIFYHAPIPVTITTKDGRTLICNECMQNTSGYSLEDHQQMDVKDLYVNPGDRKRLIKTVGKEGRVSNFPVTMKDKSGALHELLLNISPVHFRGEEALLTTGIDITERKIAEQALRETEEKFSKAFHGSPDCIDIIRSRDNVIIEVNDAFCRFTGYSREDVIGHCVADFQFLESPEEMIRLNGLFEEKGCFSDEEVSLRLKSGEVKIALMSCEGVNIGGEACKIFISHDITERKRAENALRESEEFSTSLLENAPNPVMVTNPDTSIKYVNPAFEDMTGYCLAEISGRRAPYDWWPEDTRSERMANVHLSGPTPRTRNEQIIIRKNGEQLVVKVSIACVFHDGEFKYYQTNWTDITELKQAGEALRQERNRAQNYLDIAGTMLVALDAEGRVTLINKKGCEILEQEEHDIIGKDWFDSFVMPEHRMYWKQDYSRLISGGRIINGYNEGRVVLADGREKIIAWHNTILRDESGKIIGTMNSGEDITERCKTEQALRDSEEKFSKAFHASPEAISIFNIRTGCFADVNNSLVRLTGYSRQDLIGHSVYDIDLWVDPEERDKLLGMIKRRGRAYNEEIHIFTKSGSIKSFLFSADRINIGNEKCLIAVTTDITVRKRAENELRNSEKRFRLLSDNASDLIMRIQLMPEFRVDYVSPSSVNILGYAPQDFYTDPDIASRIIHPEDRRTYEDYVNGVLKDSNGNNFVILRWICKDGRTIWMEETSTLVYNDIGIPVAVQIIARDITERKLAEQALQESEEKLNSILMSMDDLIYTLDSEGRYIFYRPERGFNMAPENFLGKLYHELMPPHVCSLMDEAILENKQGKAAEFEYWFDIDGRNEYYFAKLSPIISEEGYAGSVAVVRNITTRRRSAEKLERLYEQEKGLRKELQKEIEKRVDFTRALVHELKTPLTPVIASSEVMVDALEEEPWLSLAKNIYRGALNLNNRVDELLDVARSELGMLKLQSRWISPLGLLESIVEEMSHLAKSHGLSLRTELPESLPRIWADEVRLRQVVLNLLSNACKYAYEGGEVVLRAQTKDGNMVVDVSDTGPGLAEKDHEKVFQLYYRREKEGQNLSGLGVGLALCKTIVELHNGNIWVESEEGRGATFSFRIPQLQTEQAPNIINAEVCYES